MHLGPLAVMAEADRLAAIHSTSHAYEIARIMRETDHEDWEAYLETMTPAVLDAMTLRDEWMRPATEADGDVGGWDVVPRWNPIADARLPTDPIMRDMRIRTLVDVLLWHKGIGGRTPGDDRAVVPLAEMAIRWERDVASAEGRDPTLRRCGLMVDSWERRVSERHNGRRDQRNHIADVLQELAAERRATDPSDADAFAAASLLDADEQANALRGRAHAAFLRFRQPGIAALSEAA